MVVALGIDPGYGICGYGVLGLKSGVQWGYISTSPRDPFPKRLVELKNDISALIQEVQPDVVGLEQDMFLGRNTNASTVMQAYGVIRYAVAEAGIPEITFTTLQVKEAVAHSKATKAEMKQAVRELFGIVDEIEKDDSADGLAIAYLAQQNFELELRMVL
jgi:crossover junction endodeoxyribonuclease RuvC